MGTPAYYEQNYFRFRDDDDSEAAATWRELLNIDATYIAGDLDVNNRIRIGVAETGGNAGSNENIQFQYSLNSGTWTNITTTSSVVKAIASAHFNDLDNCTQQITSGGFEGDDCMSETGVCGGNSTDPPANGFCETELCFQVISGDVANTNTIDFRVLFDAALDEWNQIPRITISISVGYTITAESGSYGLTGQDVGLLAARKVDAESGSIALSGTDVDLKKGSRVDAESGAIVLTGQDVDLKKASKINAEVGAFVLSGQDVTLTYTPINFDGCIDDLADGLLSAQSEGTGWNAAVVAAIKANHGWVSRDSNTVVTITLGAIPGYDITAQETIEATIPGCILTGGVPIIATPTFTVDELVGYTLTAESGAYGLTGQAVGLLKASKINAEPGAFILAGQEAGLLKNSRIVIESGGYDITGQDAALLRSLKIGIESGVYNLTGQDASLLKSSLLALESGSYVLTGQDVTLLYTPVGAYILTAESGTYNLTGTAVGLLHNSKIGAEAGSFLLSGQAVGLLKASKIPAESGIYNITGQDAALLRGYYLGSGVGNYTLSGQDAGLLKASNLQAESGSYNLSGQAASLLRGFTLGLESGGYNLTGSDITLLRNAVLSAQAGAFVLTGQDVTLTYNELVTIIGCLKMIISSKAPMIRVDGKQPTIEIDSKRPFIKLQDTIC